jgi:ABC-type antimicrobial peptide transport system permease subunit
VIYKNLIHRKGRTIFAMLGISIGVAAIIGLGALTEGLQAGYGSVLTGSEADLVLRDADTIDLLVSSIDEEVGKELLVMPEVSVISGMIQGLVQAESSLYFFVFGYPEGSFVLDRFQIIDGFPLYSRDANEMRGKPIMLGTAAAESYNVGVGGSLRIGETAYRVVGIYETGEAFEDGGAVIRLVDAQTLLGMNHKVSAYYIQIKDPSLASRLVARVERKYPDLLISTAENMADESSFTDLIKIMVSVVGGLAILIGGVAMTNAQLMAVFERTREIGVLRAVGWSRFRVLMMILGESVLMGILGGVLGTGLAWLMLATNQAALSAFGATTKISPELLFRALVMVFFLGVLGGLYPALQASRLKPVEALRYEGGTMGRKASRLPVGGMVIQNLWQRKARTFLTLVVIAITIGATLTINTMLGSVDNIFGTFFSGAEIAIREADVANLILSLVDEKNVERIAAMPEVKNVSSILFSAIMSKETGVFILQGYAPREEAILSFKIVEGERINSSRQIMIGRQIAEAQNLGVGDTMNLGERRYRIVGIYEHSLVLFEMGGVISLHDAQKFTGHPGKVTFFSVSLHDPSQADEVLEKINAKFPEIHASLSGDFASESPNMQSADLLSTGISILAVLVGGVGMMNTMLMSTLERTREIGVLRALGWRRRAILGLIMNESLVLGFLGALAGIAFSVVWTTLIQTILIHDDSLKLIWTIENVIRAVVVALGLALIGGFYPALRATRLQPIEALQYE